MKHTETHDLFTHHNSVLTQTTWQHWSVHPSWLPLITPFFSGPVGQHVLARLQADIAAGHSVYPPQPLRALWLTALPDVAVVIVGQDPYHQLGQANGLAFSVAPGVNIPPSLRNMYKELYADDQAAPKRPRSNGCLDDWAVQGVLLLNTCLTVRDSQPASHASWGWEVLTDSIMAALAARPSPCVFVLWGAHAQAKRTLIDRVNQGAVAHVVLTSNHPSPLSATRGPKPFIGSGVFGRINQALLAIGRPLVAW